MKCLLEYIDCPLYELKSKKVLRYLLGIKDMRLLKQDYIETMVEPYLDCSHKPRLIEPPHAELKKVQKRLKVLLGKIVVPSNVFSGVKGHSYADNARLHQSHQRCNLFKIDLTAFFPSIRRETVYHFFCDDLRCSSDVAEALTNLTTIDIEKTNARDLSDIKEFLASKGVNCTNHLISGSPTSQLMSYLVNHNMFDEMQSLADKNGVVMSVYVDDVTFSSSCNISSRFKNIVFSIIQKYNYKISAGKTKCYSKLYPKLITGVIIDSTGNLKIKNSLHRKIHIEHLHLRKCPTDKDCRQRLRGLITAARQVEKTAYPSIHRFAFKQHPTI